MSKITAAITAVGAFVPDYVLTNQILETMVDTNDEWITTRTGIKERRILKEEGKGTSFLAIKAAKALLQKTGLDPMEIDLVIVATATPDMKAASTAAYTATKIGAANAFSFDLEAACSSFLFGMSVASSYIESGRYKKIVLIGADKNSSFINYEDRATCIIFGDGAGAVLFEPNEEGYGLQDEYLRSNGEGREFLQATYGGSSYPITPEALAEGKHYVFQDGRTVFKNAVFNMADVAEKILDQNDLNKVLESEKSESLFTLIEKWLERTPFLASEDYNFWEQYKAAVSKMIFNDKKIIEENDDIGDDEKENYFNQYNATEKMFNSLFNESVFNKMIDEGQFRLSYKATHAALLILLYREQAILHNPYRLLSKLIDLDELLMAQVHFIIW